MIGRSFVGVLLSGTYLLHSSELPSSCFEIGHVNAQQWPKSVKFLFATLRNPSALRVPCETDEMHTVIQSDPELASKFATFTRNFPERRSVTLAGAISCLLTRKVMRLREDRGVMPLPTVVSNDNDIALQKVAALLHKLKIERSYDDAFQRLRKAFAKFFAGVTPDVKVEYDGDLRRAEVALSVTTTVIFNEVGGRELRVDQVPGGMYEVLMVLLPLYFPGVTTVLLDEPGKSLHPTMKETLRQTLLSVTDRSVVIITHAQELLSEENITRVRRITRCAPEKDRGKDARKQWGSRILYPIEGRDKTPLHKWVCDPLRLPVFFSPGVIFVEGEADARFLRAFAAYLRSYPGEVRPELRGLRLGWDIIQMGGKGNAKYAHRLKVWEGIPYVILLDWDGLINDKKDGVIFNAADDWNYARNSVIAQTIKPALTWLTATKAPKDLNDVWVELKKRKSRFYVWPQSVRDIEGVTGVKKSEWCNNNFSDLLSRAGQLCKEWTSEQAIASTPSPLVGSSGSTGSFSGETITVPNPFASLLSVGASGGTQAVLPTRPPLQIADYEAVDTVSATLVGDFLNALRAQLANDEATLSAVTAKEEALQKELTKWLTYKLTPIRDGAYAHGLNKRAPPPKQAPQSSADSGPSRAGREAFWEFVLFLRDNHAFQGSE